MCEAITISTTTAMVISACMTAASTAISMYAQSEAQKSQEKSAKEAAQYNAQMAENDAAAKRQDAQNVQQKAAADIERQQRQAARAMGQMRADMGASGFTLDSGTNRSLLAQNAEDLQYESAVIQSNANQESWQHQVAGINATNQGSLYNWQAANASSGRGASYLGMAGTLLGGIGSGIGQMTQVKNTAAPNSDGSNFLQNALKTGNSVLKAAR